MILVQNRRLPLSGNKIRSFLFVSMIFTISSCGLFKKTTTTTHDKPKNDNTTVIIEDKKTETKETDTKNPDTISSETKGKSWEKKDIYNIALLLPFSLDEAELDKLMDEENITGYQPLGSLEFYEGALMALDTLKKLGVNLNVTVYNNKKDSLATSVLMRSEEFKKMDLVIGPVFNDGLKAAAEIAKTNELFTISPLSPANNITSGNKFYFMANAPISTQLNKTIEYVIKENMRANFVVVYRNDKPNELKIATEFKTEFELVNKNRTATLKEAYTFSGIAESLNEETNYVFIASNDELYVNGLVRDLSKSSRNNSITLLGMQNLLSLESISLDYFETLHFHYPTSYWADQNAPRVKRFNEVFTDKYGIRPSEFAYRGYDLMLYFGSMLTNYGPAIDAQIDKPNPAMRYMLYPLKFTASYTADKQIQFIENSNITILKYENFRFEKVN